MTVRHLEIFLAVAQSGKMTEAARRLYIAQPTVSQAIAQIERQYGVRLFERLGHELYLTPAGQSLARGAGPLVARFHDLEKELRAGAPLPLRVGASLTVGSCVMAGLAGQFERDCPGTLQQVVVDNTRAIEQMLLRNELDLGLVEGETVSPDIVARPVMEDELVLVCPPSHPFAALEEVPLAALCGQPLLLREPGSGTRELFLALMERRGLPVTAKWVCHSAEALLSAVLGGQGLSVLSRLLVARQLEAGQLAAPRLQGERLRRQFRLIHHRDKLITQPMRRFMAASVAWCAQRPG